MEIMVVLKVLTFGGVVANNLVTSAPVFWGVGAPPNPFWLIPRTSSHWPSNEYSVDNGEKTGEGGLSIEGGSRLFARKNTCQFERNFL